MGDNLKFMFSKRKQSSNLRKQILLLVYDAKKLRKEEFSYMQSEVYRIEDDISKFNALVNLTVDGDTDQVARCRVCLSPAPEAARIRQGPCSLFGDKFLGNRKHNAYKLYGQYPDLCNTFEKYCVSFPASQPETHESINKIQTPVSPINGTYPSDHYRKSGDNAQPLGSSTISSHQVEKTVSQVDGSDATGKSENISHNSHNSKFTDNTFDIQNESHNSLKLETSNMDKLIPIRKSTVKNSSEERSHRGAFPRDQMKNVCFHCRKHGHFAYECPGLCPPSRADKDSDWRHSMKQRNVHHESKNGNWHFNIILLTQLNGFVPILAHRIQFIWVMLFVMHMTLMTLTLVQ